jgi:Sulfotransferase family
MLLRPLAGRPPPRASPRWLETVIGPLPWRQSLHSAPARRAGSRARDPVTLCGAMTASADAASVARAPTGRVPDFFVVGHPKSGTTALKEMLRGHPQLYMPDLDGTQFFAPELHPHAQQFNTHPHPVEEYLSLFGAARPEQRAGEVSPSYLWSRAAAGRIAELRPDARIIAILREPASFLRSLHLELLQDHIETEKDFAKAVALDDIRREEKASRRSDSQKGLRYSAERVRYVEQLRRYHAVFPPEQVLVLIYEDFRADNEGTVQQVLRFLDVDDTWPVEVKEVNPTVLVRSPRLNELVRSLYLGQGRAGAAAKAGIKALTPRRLRRDGLASLRRGVLYGTPRPPDEELMLELRRRSKAEVVALSEYLDRDLVTLWGYDSVG